jgi:hypothetical protein
MKNIKNFIVRNQSKLILIFLLIFILDRFLFLPDRINATWEFEKGNFIGDPITKIQNIKVLNNFEIEISKNEKSASFYVIGCYFGGLYLLEKETLKYNMYSEFEGSDMWD